MKTKEEMHELFDKASRDLASLLQDKKLKVTEVDEIIDFIFCCFLGGSLESIPERKRKEYIKDRLIQLSIKIHAIISGVKGLSDKEINEIAEKVNEMTSFEA